MRIYYIDFKLDGEEKTERHTAISAAQAFQKVMEAHPTAILTRAYQQGGYGNGFGFTEYLPPSTARVTPLPTEVRKQAKLDL